jgi:hypothetical protein
VAGLTLTIAEARLTAYLEAETLVLQGQAAEMDTGSGRQKLTRADLAAIQAGIDIWQKRCDQLERSESASSAGGLRAIGVISR